MTVCILTKKTYGDLDLKAASLLRLRLRIIVNKL